MNPETLAQVAASYLTIRLGPVTLGPVETSIVVMALAAALLSGFNLWRIGGARSAWHVSLRCASGFATRNRRPARRTYRGIASSAASSRRARSSVRPIAIGCCVFWMRPEYGRMAGWPALLPRKLCAAVALAVLVWLWLDTYQLLLGDGDSSILPAFRGLLARVAPAGLRAGPDCRAAAAAARIRHARCARPARRLRRGRAEPQPGDRARSAAGCAGRTRSYPRNLR